MRLSTLFLRIWFAACLAAAALLRVVGHANVFVAFCVALEGAAVLCAITSGALDGVLQVQSTRYWRWHGVCLWMFHCVFHGVLVAFRGSSGPLHPLLVFAAVMDNVQLTLHMACVFMLQLVLGSPSQAPH
jgi:hypothetical protein